MIRNWEAKNFHFHGEHVRFESKSGRWMGLPPSPPQQSLYRGAGLPEQPPRKHQQGGGGGGIGGVEKRQA